MIKDFSLSFTSIIFSYKHPISSRSISSKKTLYFLTKKLLIYTCKNTIYDWKRIFFPKSKTPIWSASFDFYLFAQIFCYFDHLLRNLNMFSSLCSLNVKENYIQSFSSCYIILWIKILFSSIFVYRCFPEKMWLMNERKNGEKMEKKWWKNGEKGNKINTTLQLLKKRRKSKEKNRHCELSILRKKEK